MDYSTKEKVAIDTTIKITAPIEPVPFPRPSSNGKRRFNPPRYTEFKNQLGIFAKQAMKGQAPFSGDISIVCEFWKKRPKNPASVKYGDLDNLIKAVLDALQGICFVNDSQVIQIFYASKNYGEPEINIELEAI